MKNTNTNEYKTAIQTFLLDNINGESYGAELDTNKQKIAFFLNCFQVEFNFKQNKQRIPNLQNRVADYLMGLPSCIDLPIYNGQILEWAKKLHEVDTLTVKEEDSIIKHFYKHVSFHLLTLAKKNGININDFN